jgi:hypothetical protein
MSFKHAQPAALQIDFTCFICKNVVAGDYNSLTKHLHKIHKFRTSNDRKCNVECSQNGCSQKFDTFGSYRLHLKCCVKKYGENINQQKIIALPVQWRQTQEDDVERNTVSPDHELSNSNEAIDVEESFCITREVAKLMLKLKVEKNVTHSALNMLAKGLEEILREEYLSRNECPPKSCDSLHKLHSQEKRTKYYRKMFGLSDPEEIFLGNRRVWRKNKTGRFYCKLIPRTFQLFPLKQTFAALISNKNLLKMSESGKANTDGYMRGARDAKSFEKNEFLKKHPHALRLQLWSDDVEFVNPLG